jgi:hypothetical protein
MLSISFVAGNVNISRECFTEYGICIYKSVLTPSSFIKVRTVPLNFKEFRTCMRERAKVVFFLPWVT